MNILEKFSVLRGIPSDLLTRLDRNFEKVPQSPSIVSTSLDGYTMKVTDSVGSLYVDTTAGNLTVYLPDTPTGNVRRTLVKTVAANVLIIDGNGATIYGPGGWAAGVAQAFLNGRWESLTFEPAGTYWAIVGAVP